MATKKETRTNYNDRKWNRDSLRTLLYALELKLVLFDHIVGKHDDETSPALVSDCANYAQKITELLYHIQERVNVLVMQKIEQLTEENGL